MSFQATTRQGLQQVLAEILRCKRFVVTSHARPDGDAVGSVLGCVHMLRALGKHADAVLHDPVPKIYRSLPGAEQVLSASSVGGDYDAALILECDSVQRTRLSGLGGLFKINLDHHNSAREYADVNWIDPQASATTELVFRVAQAAGVEISKEIATCLYTGLLTDTGSFCYIGTNESTFELARDLVSYGADPVAIAQAVYFANPISKMRLLGAALRTLTQEGPLAWMHVSRADLIAAGAAEEDCEGVVNYGVGIEGVEVSAFFREMSDGRYRVSLRSKGHINVAHIAEQFGGGGHDCASGHPVDGPLNAALESVLGKLRSALAR